MAGAASEGGEEGLCAERSLNCDFSSSMCESAGFVSTENAWGRVVCDLECGVRDRGEGAANACIEFVCA